MDEALQGKERTPKPEPPMDEDEPRMIELAKMLETRFKPVLAGAQMVKKREDQEVKKPALKWSLLHELRQVLDDRCPSLTEQKRDDLFKESLVKACRYGKGVIRGKVVELEQKSEDDPLTDYKPLIAKHRRIESTLEKAAALMEKKTAAKDVEWAKVQVYLNQVAPYFKTSGDFADFITGCDDQPDT